MTMSIWDTYPQYTEHELRTLVAVTAQVLLEARSEAEADLFSDDVLETSPRAAAGILLPLMQPTLPEVERVQIQRVLEDYVLSQQLCVQVLGEVRACPELAQEVAAVYEQETRMMDGGISLLLVGALVVLAINLKEIHFASRKNARGERRTEFRMSFRKSGDAVKSFLTQLLKGPGPGV